MKPIQIDLESDNQLWDSFLDNSKFGTIFHSSAWLKFTEDVFNLKPCHILVENNGEPVLGIPMFFDGLYLYSPYLVDYGGMIVNNNCISDSKMITDASDILYRKILETGKRLKSTSIYIRPHFSNYINQKILDSRKTKIVGEHVYYVLSDFYDNDLLSYYHKKKRNATNNALKQDLEIERAKLGDDNAMSQYYLLHKSTKISQGATPLPKKFYSELITLPDTYTMIYFAKRNGQRVAGLTAFRYKDTIYVFDNCSDPDSLKFNPNDFIYYHLLLYAQKNRLSVDFGRTSLEDVNLCRFKERFGSKKFRSSTYREIMSPKFINLVRLGLKRLF